MNSAVSVPSHRCKQVCGISLLGFERKDRDVHFSTVGRGLRVGASFSLMLIGAAVFSQQARASVLLDAPSNGFYFYGMYCDTCIAASFTLTGSYDVSMIDVVLRTPTATSFTTFDFSLQNSLTGPITTFASAALTVPLGVSTDVINVNETLPAGTYYLVANVPGYFGTPVTPNDVDGWFLSTGVYDNAAGTVTNGVWDSNSQGQWFLTTPTDIPGYYAPAFTVNGSPVSTSPVPEPGTLGLLGGSITAMALLRRRLSGSTK